jgi:hypothetical protein
MLSPKRLQPVLLRGKKWHYAHARRIGVEVFEKPEIILEFERPG